MRQHGHDVLRLPPYHPDIDLIDNIWNIAKQWVALHNTAVKIVDIETLTKNKFGTMGKDGWQPAVCDNIMKNEIAITGIKK